MIKSIFISAMLVFICSCGFSSSDEESLAGDAGNKPTQPTVTPSKPWSTEEQDSDGDMVTDKVEMSHGRNPLVADIPEVRVRFIQNYKITVKYKELSNGKEGEFVVDTKVHGDDPDFKYRVGEIFIRNESFKNAANVGKFSTHTWGQVEEHDLSWVSYPKVDARFYSQKVLNHKKYFDPEKYEITSIEADLENSVRLKGNGGFRNIKNLTFNFYYYDYEKESYELLEAKKVERHFNSGVNEVFEVKLENLPLNLLADNYLKKGQFIISELGDFEIPEMETTYRKLLASVRAKSIPVIYNTPLESNVSFVGLNGKESNFSNVLKSLFGEKVVIQQDKLQKINQFESNLPDFTYLREVQDQDKKGKWFVFTNKLNQHYLDHRFTTKDIISLSYITGNILARQENEVIFSYRGKAESGDNSKTYPLGNVSPNSKIEIQVEPKRVWGEIRKSWSDTAHSPGGSCGPNCISREYTCKADFNIFESIDTTFRFARNYSLELGRISLLINQDEYQLKKLVDEKKVIVSWIGENIHISIPDITKIKSIVEVEENLFSVRLTAFSETTFNGVKLVSMTGRDFYFCPGITINVAGANGWPLSVESKDFAKWQHQVNWNRVKRGDRKTSKRFFSVGISGVVTNNFN